MSNLVKAFKEGKIRVFENLDFVAIEHGDVAYVVREGNDMFKLNMVDKENYDSLLDHHYANGACEITIEQGHYLQYLKEAARDNKSKTLDLKDIYFTPDQEFTFKVYDVPSNIGYAIIDAIGASSYASLGGYTERGFMSITNEKNAYVLGRIYLEYEELTGIIYLETLFNKTTPADELARVVLHDGADDFLSTLPKNVSFDETLEMLNNYILNWRHEFGEGKLLER